MGCEGGEDGFSSLNLNWLSVFSVELHPFSFYCHKLCLPIRLFLFQWLTIKQI